MQRLLSVSSFLFLFFFGPHSHAEFLKGLPVADGDYPEFVVTRSGEIRCNGVLVGPKAIALAAHCINERNPIIRFTYKNYEYTAMSIESDSFATKKHDLAIAIVVGTLSDPEPVSLSITPLSENSVVRLFSFGCDAAGEITTEFDTLRMGDTSVGHIGDLFYTVKNPSYTTECFKKLGGPAISYASNNRFIVGISPNDRDIQEHTLVRIDTRDSIELLRKAATKYGLRICGYNMSCAY